MAVLPAPVFEGSEKRLEVDFASPPPACSAGLRALSRTQLDQLLALVSVLPASVTAACRSC